MNFIVVVLLSNILDIYVRDYSTPKYINYINILGK